MKIRQEAEALDGPVLRRIGVGFVLAAVFGVVLAWLLIAGPHGPRPPAPPAFASPAPLGTNAPGADETLQYRNIVRPRSDPGARLREYGWVDRDAGIVHVPVERAFELMAAEAAASATSALPATGVR